MLHQIDELLPANSLPWDDIFAAVLLVFFGIKTLLVSAPATFLWTLHSAIKELPTAARCLTDQAS